MPIPYTHNDVIKWKHFQRYWPLMRGIHRSPVHTPAPRNPDISVIYPQGFHRLKLVIIPPYFIKQQYLWNITIQPILFCLEANMCCSDCSPIGENDCETGLLDDIIVVIFHVTLIIVWTHGPLGKVLIRNIQSDKVLGGRCIYEITIKPIAVTDA